MLIRDGWRRTTGARRNWAPGVACLLVVCAVRTAGADQDTGICDASRLRLEGQMDAQWMETLLRACEDLQGMPDLDPTARVRIAPSAGALIVEVRLEDGRATLRRVTDPSALTQTMRALLTLPPKPPEAAQPESPTPVLPPAEATSPEPLREDARPQPLPTDVSHAAARVEVGAIASGIVSGAPTYLAAGPQVFGVLHAHPWIFGVTTRWYIVQQPWDTNLQRFEMQTISASLDFGRRFESNSFALDVGAGPWLLAESQSVEQAGEEKAGTETDVRFGGFTRALVGSAPLRWAFQLDGSVSPWRVNRTVRMDEALPALPSWSLGLGVGAIWSEP